MTREMGERELPFDLILASSEPTPNIRLQVREWAESLAALEPKRARALLALVDLPDDVLRCYWATRAVAIQRLVGGASAEGFYAGEIADITRLSVPAVERAMLILSGLDLDVRFYSKEMN